MHKDSDPILGFDFGMRRIGVAVGQCVSQTAEPLPLLEAIDGIPDWQRIATLIDEWKIAAIVVGLPYTMDGSSQEMTFAARKFANRLNAKFLLPVHFVDERMSSIEAEQELRSLHKRNCKHIDSFAAVLILESWLRNQTHDKNKKT